jgi:hypothetical protein
MSGLGAAGVVVPVPVSVDVDEGVNMLEFARGFDHALNVVECKSFVEDDEQ